MRGASWERAGVRGVSWSEGSELEQAGSKLERAGVRGGSWERGE